MSTRLRNHTNSLWAVLIFLSAAAPYSYCQVLPLNKDTVEDILIHSPAFTIYKNNYFITGVPLDEKPSQDNSDAKMQISFKQRLLNKRLPLGTYLHVIYTQRSFWDIYHFSSPFRETNYNPGLLLFRPMFKENLLAGALALTIEHESNGRDSIYSRSWNFISLAYNKVFSKRLIGGLKLWIPFVSSTENNPDLVDYIGYGELELHWKIINKLFLDVVGRKGASNFKGSVQTDLSFKTWKAGNQYIVIQWWYGYAESLIDYSERQNMLRIGVMFKPTYYRFY
jgi:phospholipase A1/A2